MKKKKRGNCHNFDKKDKLQYSNIRAPHHRVEEKANKCTKDNINLHTDITGICVKNKLLPCYIFKYKHH